MKDWKKGIVFAGIACATQAPQMAQAYNPEVARELKKCRGAESIDHRIYNIKISYVVRLKCRISLKALKQYGLAMRLRALADGVASNGNVFVNYLMPWTPPGEGSWAMTHFINGRETIRILGLTKAQAKKYRQRPPKTPAKALGVWFRPSLIDTRVTIYRDATGYKILAENAYGKGSRSVKPAKRIGRGKFAEIGNGHGEFYQITKGGGMELHDHSGIIRPVFERIK